MPPESLDLIVLGTGPAAGRVATSCAEGGMSVAIIESREVGGNCALRGCNPKKVLVHAAALKDAVDQSQSHLIEAHDVRIPWGKLIAFEQTFVEQIPADAKRKYASKGIRVLEHPARFTSPTSVVAGDHHLQARHIVVATGARPAPFAFPGAEHVITSDSFLQLPNLPPRIVFLGGGYISFEFAHVAARAGATASILHRSGEPLEGFEPDLVDKLVSCTRETGITVELGAEAIGVRQENDGTLVVLAEHGGRVAEFRADLVVHGAGRVPAIDDLNLDAAGIRRGRNGITVTDALRSVSNPHVFAAGDCVDSGQPRLTPVADEQGRAIAQTLLDGRDCTPSYGLVPRVVFTVPPLASIGLSEAEARSRSAEFDVLTADSTDWSVNRKVGARVAAHKILVEKGTRRLLGAHLLGPSADETINLFALAMKHDLTADDLGSVLYVHPTFSGEIRKMLKA